MEPQPGQRAAPTTPEGVQEEEVEDEEDEEEEGAHVPRPEVQA